MPNPAIRYPPSSVRASARAAWIAVTVVVCVLVRADDGTLVDVTARTGIAFRHACGTAEKDWIAEVNGSGVALFDADEDGDLDIYFVSCGADPLRPGDESDETARNELWRNDGGWRFTDVTESAGVGDQGWGSGAVVADVDDDGHFDLYVTNMGPNVLYRGRGDGTFERVASSGAEDPRWSQTACFADFDGDRRVDLYVSNYLRFDADPRKKRGTDRCVYKGMPIFCGPGGLVAAPDSIFHNEGGGKFRDVSEEWGVRSVPPSYGLGTLIAYINDDAWPDVLVSNDTNPNFCFLNDGGRRFREAGVFLGLAYNDYGVEQAGMGLASADLTGDGRPEVFVTNFEDDTNTLYVADDTGLWTEGTFPAGLGTAAYRHLGWGTFFFDLEGDGDLDLFVANGHIAPQVDAVRASVGYRQRNQVFVNDGSGKFHDSTASLPGAEKRRQSSRGTACGDLDGDGDPDIVVNNIDAAPTILENRSAGRRITVRLRGARLNRAAIGARVFLTSGGKRQERMVRSGSSWASQCELTVRFGVGPIAPGTRVDDLRVRWPSGSVEVFRPPRVGESVTVVEGRGGERS